MIRRLNHCVRSALSDPVSQVILLWLAIFTGFMLAWITGYTIMELMK